MITIPFWMFGVGVSPNSHKHFASQTTLLVVIGEPEQILRCQVHCDRASMCLKVFLCAISYRIDALGYQSAVPIRQHIPRLNRICFLTLSIPFGYVVQVRCASAVIS